MAKVYSKKLIKFNTSYKLEVMIVRMELHRESLSMLLEERKFTNNTTIQEVFPGTQTTCSLLTLRIFS